MAPRKQTDGSDQAPAPSRIMQSRFRNICPCGRSIARGELIYYDRFAKSKVRCMPCGNKLAREAMHDLKEIARPPEVDEAIERVRHLQSAGSESAVEVRKEFAHHLWTLRDNHSDQPSVRNLFVELSTCRKNGLELFILRAKYPGRCMHCQTPQKVGSLILYDRDLRRIHCLCCEIEEMQCGR